MTETLTARVQAGIKLLDDNAPGWRDKVNPATLNMFSSYHCLLGQVYGSLADGYAELAAVNKGFLLIPYGFNTDILDDTETFDRLTDEWRRQLVEVPA